MQKLLFLLCLLFIFTACNNVAEPDEPGASGIPDSETGTELTDATLKDPEDRQPDPNVTTPDPEWGESSPPYIPPGMEASDGIEGEPVRDPASERMMAFINHLKANLSPDDYGHLYGYNNIVVELYYTNYEAVKAVVEAYGPVDFEVQYYEAKYSKSVVDAIAEELNRLDFFVENAHRVPLIYGDHDGIHIVVDVENMEEFPELMEWLETSPYKDMIQIFDYQKSPKPNPNM